MFTEFNWLEATSSSPIFLVIVGLSIVTLGVVLERAWYFWKRSGNPDETLGQALKKIKAAQYDEAAWTCDSSPHPMGKVAAEVFKTDLQRNDSLEEKLQVTLSQQKLLLEKNLNILGTMAAIAPLIGLLGTVWGIMRAFHDMAATGSAAPTVVASGVAEALVTTAAGLVVAVPALVLYNHFANRMNVMLTVAENHARHIKGVLMDNATSNEGPARSGGNAESRTDGGKGRMGQTPEPAATR